MEWDKDIDAFIKGNPEGLSPDMCIGEQADLLPYEKKFEFPKKNVVFGTEILNWDSFLYRERMACFI